ncbi:hypothetical protein [Deefgea piscis]
MEYGSLDQLDALLARL